MRKRISLQLIAGFIGIVVIAVLVIGLIFISLYQRAALETKRQDMLLRARNIALLMTDYLVDGTVSRGMGGFFRFMDTVNDAQLWILDANGTVMSLPGQGASGTSEGGGTGAGGNGTGFGAGKQNNDSAAEDGHISAAITKPRPIEAVDTISKILTGKEAVNESFSDAYGEATLTAGVPIRTEDGTVMGAVLLHAPVKLVTQGLTRAYGILFLGLGAGLLASILLGIGYSLMFTKPLKTMNRIAHTMADGNFTVRTALHRKDEFGQLGDALDNLAVSLEQAAGESSKLEQMRRDFVANVSHEFRTPLTVIRGSAEALLDGTANSPEETGRRLQAILAETGGLNRLVGDLLELSRLESGKVALSLEPVWLGELLDDVFRSISTLAAAVPVEIKRDIPDNFPPVLADYGRFRQLLLIFLDNAVKHAPAGSVITLSALREGALVRLAVEDDGPGIPAEDLPHVWERFYTVDKARNVHGTGLGLPIARQVVELMQGTVALESLPGRGTRASIRLPAAVVP
jgi:signal transduction histidine kinase